jgi:hypothetical protein
MSRLMLRRKSAVRVAALSAAGLLSAALPVSAFGTLTINLQTVLGNPANVVGYNGTLYATPAVGHVAPNNPTPAPTPPVNIYVYATVTGTGSSITSSDYDGLQYAYFNIAGIGPSTNQTTLGGAITAAIPNSSLNANFNGGLELGNNAPAGLTGNGVQAGTQVVGATPSANTPAIILGGTAITSIAKPRAANVVWGNSANTDVNQSDGNIYTSGNSTSFLVETIQYTATASESSRIGGVNTPAQTILSVSIPSVSPYVGANWFQDASSTTPGSSIQNGAYAAGASVVVDTALAGDANLSGFVNISDFNAMAAHFNQPLSANPLGAGLPYTWAQGDFTGDGVVNISDFNQLASEFNQGTLTAGPLDGDAAPLIQFAIANNDLAGFEAATGLTPAEVAADVPEPASLSLIAVGGLALLGRRRRPLG